MSNGERTFEHILKYYDMYGIDTREHVVRSIENFKSMDDMKEIVSPFLTVPELYYRNERITRETPSGQRRESIDFYDDGDEWLIIVYTVDGIFFLTKN